MKQLTSLAATLLICIFFITLVNAQTSPTIQWQKMCGSGGVEQAKFVVQCTDGGYMVAGYTTSASGGITGHHGGYDFWIVKLTNIGEIEWEKALGGSGPDWANCIQQTQDGGFVVAGYATSNNGDVSGNNGDYDYWVVKLDNTGEIQWQKALGGLTIDQAKYIEQCEDGGYVVAGTSWSIDGDVSGSHGDNDCWIVKLDSNGAVEWQQSYGGSNNDIANCIRQCSDGGYIFTGSSNSSNGDLAGNHGDFDYWVVKLDELGVIQWRETLGGTGDDQSFFVEQTTDGGYVVAGYTSSNDGNVTNNHGSYDYWVVKMDGSGTLQWQKCLGGSNVEEAYSIRQTTDGGYVVTGFSNSSNGNLTNNYGASDYWVVKLDTVGAISWQKNMGGSAVDQSYCIQQTTDGGYVVAGYSTSSNGDVTGSGINGNYWVVKLGPDLTGIHETKGYTHATVFPNPTQGNVVIQTDEVITNVYVYNSLGQMVQRENVANFSMEHLSSGIYSLQVETPKGVYSFHLIKE